MGLEQGWRSDEGEQLEELKWGCETSWDEHQKKGGLGWGQRMEQGWVNYGRFCVRGAEWRSRVLAGDLGEEVHPLSSPDEDWQLD